MTTKPPVEGAILATRLAPHEAEDPVAWVAQRLRAANFTPIELDKAIVEDDGPGVWLMVYVWCLPPNHAEIQAKREARKARRLETASSG